MPKFISSATTRNSCAIGSGISSATICMVDGKAWPARRLRAIKSAASGNCRSSFSKRAARLCSTRIIGSSPQTRPATSATQINGCNSKASNKPEKKSSALYVSSVPTDHLLPACCKRKSSASICGRSRNKRSPVSDAASRRSLSKDTCAPFFCPSLVTVLRRCRARRAAALWVENHHCQLTSIASATAIKINTENA